MFRFRTALIVGSVLALFASEGAAQNFSKYRQFEFGTSIDTVAKQLLTNASAATTVHRRPAVIQTLGWRQYSYLSSLSSSPKPDSLQTLRFDFYDGRLFRIVVGYDPVQVEGLTVEDVAEAISNVYGRPSSVEATVVISQPGRSEEIRPVLARWEDPDYSYSLFSAAYQTSFGVVAVSKKLDLMATAAAREANRLDELEAPLREAERQKRAEEDLQAAREKARLLAKPNFRP